MPHFAEQIDPNALPAVSGSNAQTLTAYAYVFADKGKLVTHSNALPVAASLPQATDVGAGFYFYVQNLGAAELTITPVFGSINGQISASLPTDTGAIIIGDGNNWFAVRSLSPVPSIKSNAQTSATYTYTASDRGRLITHDRSSTVFASLPAPIGDFADGFYFYVMNIGGGTVKLVPITGTINGAVDYSLAPGLNVLVVSNAGMWRTL